MSQLLTTGVIQGSLLNYPSILLDGNTIRWFDYTRKITKDESNLVSAWGNRLGTGELVQTTEIKKPTYTPYGLLFDGIDDFMSESLSLSTPTYFYLLLEMVSYTNLDGIFGGNGNNVWALYQRDPSPNIRLTDEGIKVVNVNSKVGEDVVIVAKYTELLKIRSDDTQSGVTANNVSSNGGVFQIGNRGAEITFANILVKDIIIRNIVDSVEDEQSIVDYLASKKKVT